MQKEESRFRKEVLNAQRQDSLALKSFEVKK